MDGESSAEGANGLAGLEKEIGEKHGAGGLHWVVMAWSWFKWHKDKERSQSV